MNATSHLVAYGQNYTHLRLYFEINSVKHSPQLQPDRKKEKKRKQFVLKPPNLSIQFKAW